MNRIQYCPYSAGVEVSLLPGFQGLISQCYVEKSKRSQTSIWTKISRSAVHFSMFWKRVQPRFFLLPDHQRLFHALQVHLLLSAV